MKNYKAFIRQATQAVSVLRDMAQLSVYDMAADGLALKTARKHAKLADVFFGSTDSPRLSARVRSTRRRARVEHGTSTND